MTKERLSKLQREIMQFITQTVNIHNIKENYYNGKGYDPDKIYVRETNVKLKKGIIDLRAVLNLFAKQKNQTYNGCYVEGKFQASFSRSIKNLVKKDILKVYYDMIPLEEGGEKLNDGNYLCINPLKQIRFILINNPPPIKQPKFTHK